MLVLGSSSSKLLPKLILLRSKLRITTPLSTLLVSKQSEISFNANKE